MYTNMNAVTIQSDIAVSDQSTLPLQGTHSDARTFNKSAAAGVSTIPPPQTMTVRRLCLTRADWSASSSK